MKRFTPKKLKNQVLVITGASSGIGLATARAAARRGAKVVLAARNGDDLRDVTAEIRASGGNAVSVAGERRRSCGRTWRRGSPTSSWNGRCGSSRRQKRLDRDQPREGSLESPQRDGRVHGLSRGHVMRSNAYTRAALSDATRLAGIIAAGAIFAAGLKRMRAA